MSPAPTMWPELRKRAVTLVLGRVVAIGELRLLFLEVRGVGQHDLEKIGGAARAVDGPREALLAEPRQEAGVVDVGVAQQDGLDGRRGHGKPRPVAQAQLLEPLEEAAVHEEPARAALEEMTGAGDRARGAEEAERRAHGRGGARRARRADDGAWAPAP